MEPVFALESDNDSDSRDRTPRLKGALSKREELGPFLGSVSAWKWFHFVFNPICLSFVSLGAPINGHPFLLGWSHLFHIWPKNLDTSLSLLYMSKRCAFSRYWRKWSNLLNDGLELTFGLSSQYRVLSQCLTACHVSEISSSSHSRYFNFYSRTETTIWFVSI